MLGSSEWLYALIVTDCVRERMVEGGRERDDLSIIVSHSPERDPYVTRVLAWMHTHTLRVPHSPVA